MAKATFRLKRTSTASASRSSASKQDIAKLIEKKAYELYEKRGKKAGYETNDWLEAERVIKAKFSN